MACGGVPGEYDYDIYLKFADQVGWQRSGDWLSYDELTFLLNESKYAHLPFWDELVVIKKTGKKMAQELGRRLVGIKWDWGKILTMLFSRAETCNL